jgi:hypothetical protein
MLAASLGEAGKAKDLDEDDEHDESAAVEGDSMEAGLLRILLSLD